jgi:hypothetical protein
VPAGMAHRDPDVWTGGALQEGSVRAGEFGLAPMYPAFGWSRSAPGHHGCKRAFDLIKRQASSGLSGSPVLDRAGKTVTPSLPFLSQTSVGNGGLNLACLPPSSVHFSCSTAPEAFSRPDHKMPRPARAEAVKAGPLQDHPKGSALRASSTMVRSHSWAPYTGWDVGSGILRTSKLRP